MTVAIKRYQHRFLVQLTNRQCSLRCQNQYRHNAYSFNSSLGLRRKTDSHCHQALADSGSSVLEKAAEYTDLSMSRHELCVAGIKFA